MEPLDQIVHEVEPALRAGDVVVLPLEYEYYVIDTPYNAWFLNQTMVGQPEWFWRLPWRDKLRFIAAVPPLRVLEGTMTRLFADRLAITKKRQLERDPEKILEVMRQAWAQGSLPDTNYTFRNIDQDGDAIVAKGSFVTYIYPLDRAVLARSYPWKTLDAFAKTCAARHVRLYVGWPPVVKGLLKFESRTARRNIQVIMQRLAEIGIPVLGHPSDFAYNRSLFADSGYHLIHEGRALYTDHMLRLLREALNQGTIAPRHSPA
jgi:signal peptidase I